MLSWACCEVAGVVFPMLSETFSELIECEAGLKKIFPPCHYGALKKQCMQYYPQRKQFLIETVWASLSLNFCLLSEIPPMLCIVRRRRENICGMAFLLLVLLKISHVSPERGIHQSQPGGNFGVFVCIPCWFRLEEHQVCMDGKERMFSLSALSWKGSSHHPQQAWKDGFVHVPVKTRTAGKHCWRDAEPREHPGSGTIFQHAVDTCQMDKI